MPEEISINYNEIDFLNNKGFSTGIYRKLIKDQGNSKTILFKFPKNYVIKTHRHTQKEQHIILEGECEIDGKLYGPGCYRYIPAGTDHASFKVKSNLVLYVIWEFQEKNCDD